MKKLISLFIMFLGVPWAIMAQGTPDFYKPLHPKENGLGFRIGTNYSLATVGSYKDNNQGIISFLGGIEPKFGFYVSGFYFKDLAPDQLTFRMESTLQMKGIATSFNGKTVKKSNYFYFGFTPLLGLRLTKKLTIYTGPEINFLIAKQNTWGEVNPFEVGTTLRVAYSIGKLKAEIGYFRGFTKVDTMNETLQLGGPVRYDFYNQNTHIGFIYILNR